MASILPFAGFEGFEIESADVPQQFAEKLHALTRPWKDRDASCVSELTRIFSFDTRPYDLCVPKRPMSSQSRSRQRAELPTESIAPCLTRSATDSK